MVEFGSGGAKARGVLGVAGLAVSLLPLAACGNFFQCENKPACPASTGTGTGTGTGSSSLDVAFVEYTNAAGNSVVTGYNVSAGALTVINSVTLPFVPIAMAVSPNDAFLYVASVPGATSPGIYAYTISSTGSLSAANNGAAEAVDFQIGAMTISPDGNFLFTVEAATQTLNQYSVNKTTGALALGGGETISSLSCAPTVATPVLPTCSVAVSPKDDFLWVSIGTQGDQVFPYSSTTGVETPEVGTVTAGTNSADFAVAFDGNDNAYVASTTTFTWWSLASTGITNRGTFTYASGSIPRSTVVDPGSKFVYTADVGTSQISGFAAGSVTQLTNSPYGAPASVSTLGIDNTDTYLVAVGYSATAGVQLYSVASSGVLSALAATAGTSTVTQDPVLVAMTH